jgi:tRNA A-37 threonylcarbamoyl transferase component Bud32
MIPIVDSQYLRSAGHEVKVPFRVKFKRNDRTAELTCSQVLRVLPEKRLVCFGEWNGRQVVAKFFMDPKSAKRHCAREKRGITALIDAGIKAPELIFKGMLPPDGMPVLIFQRIMQTLDLLTAWERSGSSDSRAKLLAQTAAVIAAQHEAGIKHDDPHFKNFLWTDNDIFTIDGDAVDTRHMGSALPVATSLTNLGLFFAQIYPHAERLAPEAFRIYAEKRAWPVGHVPYARLLKRIRRQRRLAKRNYYKKIYNECSAFVCRKAWNRYMVWNRDFNKDSLKRLLVDPDNAMSSGRVLKKGNTSTVTMVEVNGQNMVIKRYNIKNAWHAFNKSFRPSRAWVSWRNAHLLTSLGIATPKPIALVEKRLGPFRSTAYFITEYVDSIDAYCLFHSDRITEINPESIVARFGQLFQMLVDASISHGDSKATNYIITSNDLYITDLDAMREHRFKGRFRRAFGRDLARFMQNWEDLPEVSRIFREEINKAGKTACH